MTLRSLKGTKITTLSGLTRDTTASIWKEDVTPASAKDNPLALTVIKDLIDDVVSRLTGGLIEGYAPTDFIWLYGAAIDVSGSIYTVTEAAYALYNGEVYKVNTGSATLTDTIVLELSATEDGMYRTLDIADGASGSGVVDYTDIKIFDLIQQDLANSEVAIKANFIPTTDNSRNLGSASNAFADIFGYDGNFDEIYDKAGTAAPTFPEGLKSSEAVILPESNGEAIYIAEFFQSFGDNVTENLFTFTKTANNSGNGTQVIIGGSITFVGYTTETGSGRYVQTMTRIPIMIHFRSTANASLVTGTAETIQVTSNLSTTFTLSLSTANTTTAVLAVTINVSGGVNGNVPTAAPYMAILDIGQAGGGTFNSLCTVAKSGT